MATTEAKKHCENCLGFVPGEAIELSDPRDAGNISLDTIWEKVGNLTLNKDKIGWCAFLQRNTTPTENCPSPQFFRLND